MPFAAPLNWPLTLLCATTTLTLFLTFMWWVQLPSLPLLRPTSSSTTPVWHW